MLARMGVLAIMGVARMSMLVRMDVLVRMVVLRGVLTSFRTKYGFVEVDLDTFHS